MPRVSASFLSQCGLACACALLSESIVPAAEVYSALWGSDGETWSPASRLPDFSFAGYHRGEAAIPTPVVTHNVRDFGARGDGVTDDTAAFQRAITAVDRGVILIPAGRYVITDIIEVTKPGIVLRGEDRDRTILFAPKPLNDIRPNWGETTSGKPTSNYSWSGGIVWVKGSPGLKRVTDISAPTARGATTISVSSAEGLHVGDTVTVKQQDLPDNSLALHLYSDEPVEADNIKGRTSTSLTTRIVTIEGTTISLDRPLRCDLQLRWKPALHRHAPTVSEVGIENLTVEFPNTPYGGHFSELGFNAIAFNGVSNCWARHIRILHPDSGVFVTGDFNTIDDVLIESRRTPDAKRHGQGHHGITLSGNDNLLTRFDIRLQFEHDITLGACAAGNVVSEGRGDDLCLDHHRRSPYENLFTAIDAGAGTHLWRCGGGAALGWHCGARGTFWNIRAARPLAYPPAKFGPWSMNLVGLSADETSSTALDGRWFEAVPAADLRPRNLHEAQRERRLRLSAPSPQADASKPASAWLGSTQERN